MYFIRCFVVEQSDVDSDFSFIMEESSIVEESST